MHIKPSMAKTERVAAEANKRIRLARQNAGLLRLLAGVHLHEQARALAGAFHFLGKRRRDLRPVDAMDHIEQLDRVAHLVRLKRADEMQLETGMALLQRRPLCLRLLHAVLAEAALAARNRLLDRVLWHGLADGDELHRFRIAASAARCLGDIAHRPREVRTRLPKSLIIIFTPD